jgi:hypothetical protein
MCDHEPACPPAYATDRDAARVVAAQPAQGWSLLCNGVVVFDDTGELLPDGRIIAPRPPRLRPSRHTLSSLIARLGTGGSPGILRRFVAAD